MKEWQNRLAEIYAPPAAPSAATTANTAPLHPTSAPERATASPASNQMDQLAAALKETTATAPAAHPLAGVHRTVRLLGRRSVAVRTLAVSPDGQTVIAAHGDGQVRLSRTGTGLLLQTLQMPGEVRSLAISADGRWLAVGISTPTRVSHHHSGTATCELRLINLRHGSVEQQLAIPGDELQCLRFDPSGQRLAVAAGATLGLWDPWSGNPKLQLRGHEQRITCLAFSADGQWLVSADAGGELRTWHASTGQSGHGLRNQGEISGLALSGDGVWLAWGARDGTVLVSAWSPQSIDRIRQIEGQGRPVAALSFSADHRWLVIGQGPTAGSQPQVGGGDSAQHSMGQVCLWSTTRGEREAAHPLADAALSSLAVGPDGRWLALGCANGDLRLIGTEDGRLLRRWARAEVGVTALALSPDQQWLASGREDGQVSVWHPVKGELLREMAEHRSPVSAVGFSADGRWWGSGARDGTLLLWGRGKPHPRHAQPGLRWMSFCPRNQWLALAGDTGQVQLLALREPLAQTIPTLHKSPFGILGLRFSGHGHLLAWVDEQGSVTCCEPASGQVRSRHQLTLTGLASVALSDDLRWLAAATRDGVLQLWDLNADRESWRVHLPSGGEAALLFSPDGQVLHACGADGVATDWLVATGEPLHRPAPAGVSNSSSSLMPPPHYNCLGLAHPRHPLHEQPLASEGLQLLSA